MNLPPKPRYTQPCNHCGQCCQQELCPIAEIAYPDAVAPCPALIIGGGKARCGIVLTERQIGAEPLAQRALGIGTGCSMVDPDTTDGEIEEFNRVSYIKIFNKEPPTTKEANV